MKSNLYLVYRKYGLGWRKGDDLMDRSVSSLSYSPGINRLLKVGYPPGVLSEKEERRHITRTAWSYHEGSLRRLERVKV